MQIDRSKFKTSVVAEVKQEDKNAYNSLKGESSRAQRIELDKGKNIIRLAPIHPDSPGKTYAEPVVVHYVPMLMDKKDKATGQLVKDSKGEVEKVLVQKRVFNAKVHGKSKKDIIDEYIAFAEKLAADKYGSKRDEIQNYLEPIFGNFKKKINGIGQNQSWASYAWKIVNGVKTFGSFEVKKAIKFRLNAIASVEEANQPLGTDPYTDTETGRNVIIMYNPDADKPQDYYQTELETVIKGGQVVYSTLTDDDLIELMKYPSLYSQYRNVYSAKDFKIAIEGLKLFDDANKFKIFGYDEFIDIAEELASEYGDEDADSKIEEDEEIEDNSNTKVKTVSDEFDLMTRDDMKVFAKNNKTGILIKTAMSDDDIKTKLRNWKESQHQEAEEQHEEKQVEDEKMKASSAERLAKLKSKK